MSSEVDWKIEGEGIEKEKEKREEGEEGDILMEEFEEYLTEDKWCELKREVKGELLQWVTEQKM